MVLFWENLPDEAAAAPGRSHGFGGDAMAFY